MNSLTVIQNNCECCQFESIFEGAMPHLELIVLKMHSFLHFSPTCFSILSCFCILLCLTVIQIKFECCQFASVFEGALPLLELRTLKCTVFCTFLLHA